jgi:Ca2+-transporting ATPase
MAKVGEFAGTAHKVIACAELCMATDRWLGGEPERGYGFAGLLAFEDPVRDGAADAVRLAREAGIHVIMVTGDHPATAAAVAVELGIGGKRPVVLDGDELDRLLVDWSERKSPNRDSQRFADVRVWEDARWHHFHPVRR